MLCPKCGFENIEGSMFCNKCGVQLQENLQSEDSIINNQLIESNKQMKRFSKKAIISLVVALVIVFSLGFTQYNNKKLKEYEASFNVAYTVMNEDARLVSTLCQTYNAGYSSYLSSSYYGTFTDYLKKVDMYGTLKQSENTLSERKPKLDNLMSKLRDYPKSYEEKYKKLNGMYETYNDMYDISKGFYNYSIQTTKDFIKEIDNYTDKVNGMKLLMKKE